jgi:hypothetical protein
MKKIIMPRGEGKTDVLIKMSAESGACIVCESHKAAWAIECRANKSGLIIPFPITYNEFINRRYPAFMEVGFLIDNVDLLVQEMTHLPVRAITMNSPESVDLSDLPTSMDVSRQK